MVKSIKDAVQEVVEGKKQSIIMEFHEDLYDAEKDVYFSRVQQYDDIAGYQLNGDWVAIMMKDSTTHVYPASSVRYVKHFTA